MSSTANTTTGTSRTGAGTAPHTAGMNTGNVPGTTAGTNTGTVHGNSATTGPGTGTTTGGIGKSHGGQGKQVGTGLKEVFAKVHGVGEEIRGEFNSAIDETFNENGGVAKNQSVASAGRNEQAAGQFSRGTKQREGVEPAVGGGVGGRGERST